MLSFYWLSGQFRVSVSRTKDLTQIPSCSSVQFPEFCSPSPHHHFTAYWYGGRAMGNGLAQCLSSLLISKPVTQYCDCFIRLALFEMGLASLPSLLPRFTHVTVWISGSCQIPYSILWMHNIFQILPITWQTFGFFHLLLWLITHGSCIMILWEPVFICPDRIITRLCVTFYSAIWA